MKSQPISTRMPTVLVEYDSRGKRVTRRFENPFEARAFWVRKDREGRNPKVLRDSND